MKLSNILSDFLMYLLLAIILLGAIIAYAGFKTENTLFIISGLAILFPLGIWLIFQKIKEVKSKTENQNRIQKLIIANHKISVDLNNLDIKSNSYIQEVTKGYGSRSRNIKVNTNHNVIILEIPYNKDFINYRIDINMESTKLKMHFAIKQETFLYIDKANKNNNYLDLTFLD